MPGFYKTAPAAGFDDESLPAHLRGDVLRAEVPELETPEREFRGILFENHGAERWFGSGSLRLSGALVRASR